MSVEKVMTDARTYMRDYARHFTAAVARTGITTTFEMPHGNIMPSSLLIQARKASTVANGQNDGSGLVTATGSVFGYLLDEREGLVRVNKPITSGFDDTWSFVVEGYYYEWVSDRDLRMFANNLIAEHAYHREDWDPDNIDDAEEDALALGTAVEALWSLLIEFSRDIDINTPEGVPVPATQRYAQVSSLLGNLSEKYNEKSGMLGVGIASIQMITLRRRSRTTNRLVPIYREREWDDARIPTRVFPAIPIEGPTSPPPDFRRFPTVQGFYDAGGEATPNP